MNINPIWSNHLQIWFCIFFYSLGWISFCPWFPLLCKELSNLTRPTCLLIVLFPFPEETDQKNIATIYVNKYSVYFCLARGFIYLTFRSLIHFEIIFVYGLRECSNFILSYSCPVSSAPLIKEMIFSPWSRKWQPTPALLLGKFPWTE